MSLFSTDYYNVYQRDDGYIAMAFGLPLMSMRRYVVLYSTTDWQDAVDHVASLREEHGNGFIFTEAITKPMASSDPSDEAHREGRR